MLQALQLDCERERSLIVGCIRKWLADAGFSRVVIGVSGGVDSSLTASLCVQAVGAENVMGMILPCRTSSPDSEAHARLLLSALGVPSIRFDITAMVQPLANRFSDMSPGRLGNIMARCRMIVLYDQSVAFGGLVAGTSNRTETLLGYFTLYGDGAAAFEPIGHLFKCQVLALARHLGVPKVIVEKAPSADLWAGQTDEGELGFTYDEADQVLYLLTVQHVPHDEIVAYGFDADVVHAIARRMAGTAFKRRLPPIPSPGLFGADG